MIGSCFPTELLVREKECTNAQLIVFPLLLRQQELTRAESNLERVYQESLDESLRPEVVEKEDSEEGTVLKEY